MLSREWDQRCWKDLKIQSPSKTPQAKRKYTLEEKHILLVGSIYVLILCHVLLQGKEEHLHIALWLHLGFLSITGLILWRGNPKIKSLCSVLLFLLSLVLAIFTRTFFSYDEHQFTNSSGTALFKVMGDTHGQELENVKIKLQELEGEPKDIELFLKTNQLLEYYQEFSGCLTFDKKFAKTCGDLTLKVEPPDWMLTVQSWRKHYEETLGEAEEITQALLPGFVYGDTSKHSPQLKEDLKRTGLTHLSAVSGANCALILLITHTVFRLRRAPVVLRCVIQLVVLGLFIVLVRVEPSALRAGLMAGLALLWTVAGNKVSFHHALSCTILIVLLYDPWMSQSYGFLLSCAASLALVTSAKPCAERIPLPSKISYAIAIPLVAQLWCMPLLVFLSEGFPTYSVFANVLALPATGLSSSLGYILLIFPFLAPYITWFCDLLCRYIAFIAEYCASLPAFSLPFPKGILGFAIIMATYLVAYILHRRKVPYRKTVVSLLLSSWLVWQLHVERFFHLTELKAGDIVQCNVDQGDAYLIATEPGNAVMIDVGPDNHMAKKCLERFQVETINLLIISHMHDDHYGGIKDVLAITETKEALIPVTPEPEQIYSKIHGELEREGAEIHRVQEGHRGQHGNISWEILSPKSMPRKEENINNTSIVLSVTINTEVGEYSVLFTGDSEKEIHHDITRDLRPHDVLKVPHHGSKTTNPDLLAKVQPQVSLISAGKNNKHKHPHKNIVSTLEQQGTNIVRTDQTGTSVIRKSPEGFDLLE